MLSSPTPVTLKASCLASWNIPNAAGTSADTTGNRWFREKNKVTNQREPGAHEDPGPGLRRQHGEFGAGFVFADLWSPEKVTASLSQ